MLVLWFFQDSKKETRCVFTNFNGASKIFQSITQLIRLRNFIRLKATDYVGPDTPVTGQPWI